MLRVSARKTNRDLDLRGLVDPDHDSLLPHGAELLTFTNAVIERDRQAMAHARQVLLESAGEAATVRAAAVAGNFQMMNRLLDAIGVRVGRAGMTLAGELGLKVPSHLHPS